MRDSRWRLAGAVYLIALALMVGLTFSSKWIGYEYERYVSDVDGTIVPLRYGYGQPSDDYFYYTRVRDFIDGDFLAFDPVSLENRHVPNPHSNFQAAYFFAAVGGLIDGSTKSAFYFNTFVFPIVSMLLVFLIIYRFTQALFLSSVFAAASVLFNFYYAPDQIARIFNFYMTNPFDGVRLLGFTQANRMPNLMVTNVHLSLLMLALGAALNSGRPVFRVATVLLLGLSSLISVHNFLLSYALMGSVVLWCTNDKVGRAQLVLLGALASVVSLPGVWMLYTAAPQLAENVIYSLITVGQKANPVVVDTIRKWAVVFAVAGAIVLAGGGQHRRFLLAVVAAPVLVFAFATAMWGTFFAELVVIRGVAIMLATVVSIGLIGMGYRLVEALPTTIRARVKAVREVPAVLGLACLGPLAFFGLNVPNDYLVDRRDFSLDDYKGGAFMRLADWSQAATTTRDVAVTLDFDLLINLPVYSPLNSYVPQAILSSVHGDERFERFFEVARFYGMTADDMDRMLDRMTSHYDLPYEDADARQRALMQLALFYGRHARARMPAEERAALVDRYAALLAASPGLTWQADYLVLTPEDRRLVRPGSPAARAMATAPLYDDGRYFVYSLH